MSESHDRIQLRSIGRHLLIVAGFNTVIGIGLSLGRLSQWDVQMVYSQAIGLSIWLLIDVGRFLLVRDLDVGWPRGWRAALLMGLSVPIGFAVGVSIGDAYCGCKSFEYFWRASDTMFKAIAFSSAISYFFYSRGKDQARMREIAAAQRDAAEAQLRLLESQLEPHMLFNTLANLRVLIGMDAQRAQAMLDRLIAFLRATLSASRQRMHPLADEYARLGDYLALMQIRMGERLRVTLELPPELAAWPVPPLILQPLVENAIKHGLEPQRGGGSITVRAERDGDGVRLSVLDSGVGLSDHVLKAAAPSTVSPPVDGNGFGLDQVRKRLNTLYGAAGSFSLSPAESGGALAVVRLPANATPSSGIEP